MKSCGWVDNTHQGHSRIEPCLLGGTEEVVPGILETVTTLACPIPPGEGNRWNETLDGDAPPKDDAVAYQVHSVPHAPCGVLFQSQMHAVEEG
jgi:hypothetical protein